MKECPCCAKEIQDKAIRCKHCGEWFNEENPVRPEQSDLEYSEDFECSFNKYFVPVISDDNQLLIDQFIDDYPELEKPLDSLVMNYLTSYFPELIFTDSASASNYLEATKFSLKDLAKAVKFTREFPVINEAVEILTRMIFYDYVVTFATGVLLIENSCLSKYLYLEKNERVLERFKAEFDFLAEISLIINSKIKTAINYTKTVNSLSSSEEDVTGSVESNNSPSDTEVERSEMSTMTDKIIRINKIEKTFSVHKVSGMVSDGREKLWLDYAFSSEDFVKSPVDPMNLFSAFPCLRMKNDFVLRAYVWRDMDGIGSVFAMRTDAPFPEPSDCPILREGKRFGKPIPEGALREIMQVVEGDGSLWSYLSASMFFRAAKEFGAFGHLCDWTSHGIIGSDYWETNKAEKWKWEKLVPLDWDPVVRKENKIIKVTFYTICGYGTESIKRHVDTYRYGSYEFQSVAESVAWGEEGFVV